MNVKFASESLEIYSWVKKMQYTAFCHALTSGINQHLQVLMLLYLFLVYTELILV